MSTQQFKQKIVFHIENWVKDMIYLTTNKKLAGLDSDLVVVYEN